MRWIWAVGLAIVVTVQWPMLKGLYYRTASTPPPPSSIEWRTDLAAALEEADRSGKPVIIDVSADWCPPCVAMKHEVWPDAQVEEAISRSFIPVLIDADRNGEVLERYRVTSIPAVLAVDDDGDVIRRAAYLSAEGMMRFLNEVTAAKESRQ